MTTEYRIPDLGGASDVDVIELSVAVGDSVTKEQTLLVLETDKASMEIPAEAAGIVADLHVSVGDKINEGDVFIALEVNDTADAAVTEQVKEQAPLKQAAEPDVEQKIPERQQASPLPSASSLLSAPALPLGSEKNNIHAGPAVRKLARELGVDLSLVMPSGIKKRITKEDVQRFVKQHLQHSSGGVGSGIPTVPEIDFSQFGPVSTQPLNNVKKATAKAMTTAWLNVPQVTQFDQADITDLEAYRKQQNQLYAAQGIKFSIVPFVMKVIAKVLREFPNFNASLSQDGEALILKDYVHIGVAVDTPKGLLVPVIRDVDQLSVTEITQQLNEKAQQAREGKLSLSDMQGGCFSLSSLGGIGGTSFTPIVNPPEVAILGLSKADVKPRWNGETFSPQLMLPLSLSYDHRVIDGAEAAKFTQRIVTCLQDLRNVLM